MNTPVKPIVWMRALRDDPSVIGTRLAVLWALGLRVRKDGTGWAPQRRLAADVGVSERTVRRVLKWAEAAGVVEQTSRGHRRGDGVVRASEYRLLLPSLPDTGDRLRDERRAGDRGGDAPSLPDNDGSLPDNSEPQPDTGVHPRGQGFKGSGSTSVPPFGGSPAGDRDWLELYEQERFRTPVELGRVLAEVSKNEEVFAHEIVELVREHFEHDDEKQAFAVFHDHGGELAKDDVP